MQKVSDNLTKGNLEYFLDEAYDEALKDDNFKEFVSKLKVRREILKKYTTLLEESSIEYFNCKNCSGLASCKNKVVGYAKLPKLNGETLEFSYKPCKYKNKFDKEEMIHSNTKLFNVPKEIKEASIKKIYKTDKNRYKTILWLTEFIKNYKKNIHQKGLYLCGNFGCGKTYLIAAIFNELGKEGIKSAILTSNHIDIFDCLALKCCCNIRLNC